MNQIEKGIKRLGLNHLFLKWICFQNRRGKGTYKSENCDHQNKYDRDKLEGYWPDQGKSAVRKAMEAGEKTRIPAALTIIVPVYQAEAYIRRCAESLAAQKTAFLYRVIFVDDGTKDKSFEKISDLLKGMEQFFVVRQENKGLSGARNRGISCVETEYVCFVDADDFVSEDMVELLMKRAVKTGADITVGNFSYYYEENGKLRENPMSDGLAEDPYRLPGIACGKVFRASLFDQIKFPEGYLYEDSVVKHVLFPMASRIQCVEKTVYFYRMHKKSLSSTAKVLPRCVDSTWITIRMLKDRKILGLPVSEEYKKYFLRQTAMNYQREAVVPEEIRYQVFLLMCSLANEMMPVPFSRKEDEKSPEGCLRRALLREDYRTYKRLCRWM